MIKLFYQKDPLWANIKIPRTNLKIGNYGCNICNIASLCCYYGREENPATITPKLDFVNGLVIWKSLTNIYPEIKFIKRIYQIGAIFDFSELKEYIKRKNPVIAEVRLSGRQHFILIYSRENNNYLMLDPALNFNGIFEKYYSKIYGLVFFEGPKQQGQNQQTTPGTPFLQGKLNIDTSIVDYLKYRGLDSSFPARAQLYQKIFGKEYFGTAQQNAEFLAYAKKNI